MGQRQAKRTSNFSPQPLLRTCKAQDCSSAPASPITLRSPFSYDDNEITPPAPARVLNRLSEIIDPRDVLQDELYLLTPMRCRSSSQPLPVTFRGIVQSPSGNELGAEEFIMHPNRPLAMWERQERVMQATREGMERFEMESRMGNRLRTLARASPELQRRSKRKWWCFGCLCQRA